MNNPVFMPRFGVILEAYMKGCGEAMLVRTSLFLLVCSIMDNILYAITFH